MFISFEGLDGSGKSTQAKRLAVRLRSDGYTVVEVREPGGTGVAEAIRQLLLDATREISPRAELLLFSAARADLTERVIRPALDRGHIVIADRFYDSTTAYQGAGRGIADSDWLRAFHRYVTAGLSPDVTYLLDISPQDAALRAGARGEADRMEASGEAFYARVAQSYAQLAALHPERVVVVEGAREREEVEREIARDVRSRLDPLER